MVLLWPVVTGRPAAAVADEPPPYYDCQGNALTPEEFDVLVERLAEIAAGYGQVFSVPFGYCDEGPLVIEGLPAECTFAQGWRNYLSDSPEAFLLEPLDVVLFTIDELIAEGLQIAPEDAQVLRAHEFRMGYMAGVVQTAAGDQAFYGQVIAASGASGGVWSAWVPLGTLGPDYVTVRRALVDGALDAQRHAASKNAGVEGGELSCWLVFARCIQTALRSYREDVRTAERNYLDCANRWNWFIGVVIAGCIATGLASGGFAPAVFVACLAGGSLARFLLPRLLGCARALERDVRLATDDFVTSAALCVLEANACLAQKTAPSPATVAAPLVAGR